MLFCIKTNPLQYMVLLMDYSNNLWSGLAKIIRFHSIPVSILKNCQRHSSFLQIATSMHWNKNVEDMRMNLKTLEKKGKIISGKL